jgi:hypothetical protein
VGIVGAALAGIGVSVLLTTGAFAQSADDGATSPGTDARPAPHARLSDEQKACLEAQGLTRPAPGTRPTEDQRAAAKAALEACGIPTLTRGPGGPGFGGPVLRGPGLALTDEQKACLRDQLGDLRPTAPVPGQRPSLEDLQAKHDELAAAAAACGVPLPSRPAGPTLTRTASVI